VSATAASEGTLLVLGLLTVLHSRATTRLILLDDLDRGLHPIAQKNLIATLRRLLAVNPEMQLVATSHSPYLLDNLQPEEVRITALDGNGQARCARLVDHPEFEKWREQMLPGEFWSVYGERWINPSHQVPAAQQ
jgi:predicted ATPase